MRRTLGSIVMGLVLAGAAQAQDRMGPDSPIDFMVGNEVVTRAEVLRAMGDRSVVDPGGREALYRRTRLNMAKDSVLYQHARHIGIEVTGEAARSRLQDQIRESADGAAFLRAMRQVYANDLGDYVEKLRRQITVTEFQRRVWLGAEVDRVQPMQIIFAELRPADAVRRAQELAIEREADVPGILWEAQVRGTDDAARKRADAIAKAWNDPALARSIDQAAPRSAIRTGLARAGVDLTGVGVDIASLSRRDWAPGIYRPDKANNLYQALRRLQPGKASEPVELLGTLYVFRLVRDFSRQAPDWREVESDARNELTRDLRSDRLRARLRDALATMHVWPADLARELADEAQLDPAKH